jgi:hypothetical protein
MKKETERMLGKEARNFKNFLPENRDNKYNNYLKAKDQLKNSRIEGMMNYKRNNEELQLLIESGMMDEPENIRRLIDQLNAQGTPLIEEETEREQKGLVIKQ